MTEYQRIKSDAETPADAVVMTVRAGPGRTVADVAAIEHVPGAPVPVHLALAEAEQLRKQLKLRRVVIVIEDEQLWQSAWGHLVG